MDKVYDKCCGIDVHKKLIVACLKKGNSHEIREFGATTRELLSLAAFSTVYHTLRQTGKHASGGN